MMLNSVRMMDDDDDNDDVDDGNDNRDAFLMFASIVANPLQLQQACSCTAQLDPPICMPCGRAVRLGWAAASLYRCQLQNLVAISFMTVLLSGI